MGVETLEQQRSLLESRLLDIVGGSTPATCYAFSFSPQKAEVFLIYQSRSVADGQPKRFNYSNKEDGDFRFAIPEALDCSLLEYQVCV